MKYASCDVKCLENIVNLRESPRGLFIFGFLFEGRAFSKKGAYKFFRVFEIFLLISYYLMLQIKAIGFSLNDIRVFVDC